MCIYSKSGLALWDACPADGDKECRDFSHPGGAKCMQVLRRIRRAFNVLTARVTVYGRTRACPWHARKKKALLATKALPFIACIRDLRLTDIVDRSVPLMLWPLREKRRHDSGCKLIRPVDSCSRGQQVNRRLHPSDTGTTHR